MRWRLILKEFGSELKYIKGENNVLADTLSRLEMSDNQEILNISELYGYNDADLLDISYPIHYHNIYKAQKTGAKLSQNLVSHKDYTFNTFRGGDQNHRLICQNRKMLTYSTTKENCILVSQDDMPSRRDSHITYPPSTFRLNTYTAKMFFTTQLFLFKRITQKEFSQHICFSLKK